MFSQFRQITCNDGSIRLVLRKISDIGEAFSLHAPQIDFTFNSALKMTQQIAEGNFEAGLKKQAVQIFDDLNSTHIDAVHKFTMSYTVFMANPCDGEAYKNLTKVVDQIHLSLDKLRELQTEVQKLSTKQLGTTTTENAIENINSKISDLKRSYKVF
jgi:hypothetical protein